MRTGIGANNRYLERLNTGKIKIREVMARKGDTPEYVNKMQQEVFRGPGRSNSLDELKLAEPKARKVYTRYLKG